MTLLDQIKNLNWFTLLEKLKVILPQLINGEISEGTELPYKVYTALLTQTGTDNPVATVLENTLGGDVSIVRDNSGYYLITSDSLFTIGKTVVSHQAGISTAHVVSVEANYDASELNMLTQIFLPDAIPTPKFDESDLILSNNTTFSIEIKVYNDNILTPPPPTPDEPLES